MATKPHSFHHHVKCRYECLLYQGKVTASYILAIRVSISIPDTLETFVSFL